MTSSTLVRPDVLVLGAGGILGEAWLSGVLAGIEDASELDLTQTGAFVGTSAGAIVSANLAAGHHPRRPSWAQAATGSPPPAGAAGGQRSSRTEAGPDASRAGPLGRWATLATAPLVALAPLALAAGAPAGAFLRAAALARVPDGRRSLSDLRRQIAGLNARFDGRLRVVGVERRSGRRAVFGAPGSPAAEVADAVAASCAIPGVFSPVSIGGRPYVDGGVWSLNNLDAAPVKRGAHVLCLTPTAGLHLAARSPFAALRAAAHASLAVESLALRRRGARVRTVAPDAESASLMALNLMDPGPAQRVLAAGFAQGRRLAGPEA